jgi:hypothetical protein
VPALGTRDEHGLHRRGEPLQGETGGGVVDFLCVLLTGIAPAHEKVRLGEDMLRDLSPVGLPNNALGKEACVAAQ